VKLCTLGIILIGSLLAYAQTPGEPSKTSAEEVRTEVPANKKVKKKVNIQKTVNVKKEQLEQSASQQTTKASGGVAGGGGGEFEPVFKNIAENIASWIESGNADLIQSFLPSDISLAFYKANMLRVLKNYNVTFTDDKVMVGNYEKTCRSFVDNKNINQIICNNSQFGIYTPQNAGNIYRQVHHEFAGLACRQSKNDLLCVEKNDNEISDYKISDKITAFLGNETVIRLPVKPGMIFGESYVCSAIKASGQNCGSLEIAPDLSKITQDPTTGTFYDNPLWYKAFPNCSELKLFSIFSSQRRLLLVLAVEQNPTPEEAQQHITTSKHFAQLRTDSTLDSFTVEGLIPNSDFLTVECKRK
jgi:hypothetical protein